MADATFPKEAMSIAITLMKEVIRCGQKVRLQGKGSSMEPMIPSGYFVRLAPAAGLKEGDIVALWMSGELIVIHRVIRVGNRDGALYIITKGDNSPYTDPPVLFDRVIGKVSEITPD